jgi:hypothetical protein
LSKNIGRKNNGNKPAGGNNANKTKLHQSKEVLLYGINPCTLYGSGNDSLYGI